MVSAHCWPTLDCSQRRLRFGDASGAAPFQSALFYLGPDPSRFFEVFGCFGTCYQAVWFPAAVVELVYTTDLKSVALWDWEFESLSQHWSLQKWYVLQRESRAQQWPPNIIWTMTTKFTVSETAALKDCLEHELKVYFWWSTDAKRIKLLTSVLKAKRMKRLNNMTIIEVIALIVAVSTLNTVFITSLLK